MVNEEEWEKIKDAPMFKTQGIIAFHYHYPRIYALGEHAAYKLQKEYCWYRDGSRSMRLVLR